jgi:hypothetical protein
MVNSNYYENTTISTTEGSFTEESNKQLENKIKEMSLESLSIDKEEFLEKIIKIITDTIEKNTLNSEHHDIDNINSEIKVKDELNTNGNIQNLFSLKKTPSISLSKYIKRIDKYLDPEISTYVISLIYIYQITSQEKNKILINNKNAHKLILTSISIAMKYNQDDTIENKFVAQVGGFSEEELLELELNFCNLLNWELFIPDNLFKNTMKSFLEIKLFN